MADTTDPIDPEDSFGAAQTVGLDQLDDWAESLPAGTTLGRYVLLSKLGAGGAGMVFAAFDPELDRKVAIKLLRAGDGGALSTSQGQARLLREAQAMAKLNHPNVMPV